MIDNGHDGPDWSDKVEIPTLKSLYIELRVKGAKLGSGTAILVADDKDAPCVLITNRHIATGRHNDTGEPLHSTGAIPDEMVIYFHVNDDIGKWKEIALPLYRPNGKPFWIEHPRLGEKADIVALNLSWGNDVTKVPYYLKLNLDRMNILVQPAEPVSVIGFPFGRSSVERFPIWATGFLAQELSLVSAENPTFLIDCRTRPGQSGSGVIAFRPGGYRQMVDGKFVSKLGSHGWEFLGVYSGRLNAQSDLGRVWHVSAVEELYAAAAAVAPPLINPSKIQAD